ncbi:heavy metal translocating P-type ATPase [Streptomyces sp. ODS28]|uniref:heavy metal translocating P-type ATPase n=1 Tax=Streptomyces sp. ODS28 TaxID=3136688 RepID=UPI0031EB34FB
MAMTRIHRLPEARWAALAALAFLVGLALHLSPAPEAAAWCAYAVCYAAGGWEPAKEGLSALREKTLDVDLLMVVAALGAAAIGQPLEGALLIVIFATSGALEAFATQRTADSVRGLLGLAPQRTTRIAADGTEESVETAALRPGDTVLVRPGERIGADGTVTEGSSDVDQASITGEPLPVPRAAGDEVFAGTLNGNGALRVRVEREAGESVIARIVGMVEEASRTKAPAQLFIEKVEQRYALGMVAATLAVFLVPLALGEALEAALLRAMTFMIVASPCAVVLATMPPLLAAIANAGRHGVLVKSAAVMERLGTVTRVAFDKTGTLTEGAPRLAEAHPLGDDDGRPDRDRLLALAAAAERGSEHPLGRAVVSAAAHLPSLPVRDFEARPGRGVSAVVDGVHIEIGAPARMPVRATAGAPSEAGAETRAEDELARLIARTEESGLTVAVVLADGAPLGVLGFADRPRPYARDAVGRLRHLTGAAPLLLTGDHRRAAERLAAETGCGEVRAGLLPQDKVAAVREAEASGERLLLVGDGVNDAPALASAHTGLAMGRAGSDLALESADAVLVRDELRSVPAVMGLSRRARRLVVQNLVIAATAIAALVTWDLVGTLPLPLGVAGHEGSTILVGLNGLRLLRNAAWQEDA